MNDFPNFLRHSMQSIIHDMSQNNKMFVVNPEKNFTRDRKLNFKDMINIILSMGGKSIYSELLDYTGYAVDTPTPSGFVQQRSKLLPYAFEYLFKRFTKTYMKLKTFNGYRMIAVDGSILISAANSNEPASYTKLNQYDKRYNELHLNALICIGFFRCRSNISLPDVEALIQKNVLPIRDGRNYTRNVRSGHPVSLKTYNPFYMNCMSLF